MFSFSEYRRRGFTAAALGSSAFILATFCAPASAARGESARPAAVAFPYAPIVKTANGPVVGRVVRDERAYLGIPYAAPPVGPLRWAPPAAHAPWSGLLQATQFGPHCPQPASPFGRASLTEDCLYLNVFSPAHDDDRGDRERRHERRPVMVWIHGGAFTVGESDDYDPAKLVARGVVVVTLNYRLGPLGFLAHPALDTKGHLFANYGLLDQQAALAWVKRNVAAFGGDSDRVTIFGESAGGASVISQLASPLASGKFQRSIIESGAYLNTPTLGAAEAAGTAYATAEGCKNQSAACLRALPVAAILAHEATGYEPSVDGTILPLNPRVAFVTGKFNRVPVIDGSNSQEFRLFTALNFDLRSGPLTSATYPLALAAEVGPAAAPLVLAQYPLKNYPSPDLANSAALTDATFACNALFLDHSLSSYVLTFGYEFADENAPEPFLPPVSFPYGAAHASEIQYLFNLTSTFHKALDPEQERLSRQMVSYWTNFARFGIPFAQDSAFWFPFVGAYDDMLRLNTPGNSMFTNFSAEHHCAFWQPLLAPTAAAARASAARPLVRAL